VRDACRLGRHDIKILLYYYINIKMYCLCATTIIRRSNYMIFIRLSSEIYRADDERTLIIYRWERI